MRIATILVSFVLLAFTGLRAQQTQDVFVPIGKYIQQGDSESLSAWFANNLELDILGKTNDCSKVQATQKMKDFFVTYSP